eukprot:Rmarinus@m.15035
MKDYLECPIFTLLRLPNGDFFVGGGGGAAKTGVPNKMYVLRAGLKKEEPVKIMHSLDIHDACVASTFGPKKSQVFVGIGDECKLYEIGEKGLREVKFPLNGLPSTKDNPVHSLASSRNGKTVAVGYEDGTVAVATLNGSKVPTPFRLKQIRSLAVADDGEMVSVALNAKCLIWKSSTKTFADLKVDVKDASPRVICFGRNSHDIYVAAQSGRDCYLSLCQNIGEKKKDVWVTSKSRCVVRRDAVTCMTVSPDGAHIMVGLGSGGVAVFDAKSLKRVGKVLDHHGLPTTGVGFTDDGGVFSVGPDSTYALSPAPSASMFAFVLLVLAVVVAVLAAIMRRIDEDPTFLARLQESSPISIPNFLK